MSTQLQVPFPSIESLGPEFLSVADSINEGLVLADENGVVRFVNARFLELTGFNGPEILGKKIFEIFFPSDGAERDREKERMLERYQARREGVSEIYETHIIRKDGQRRWIETKAGPLYDGEGRIIGSIGANSDITEKKQLEEQLRWSQKMEAVGRLAGGIAHDFNNLLTVIQGYADLLRQQLASDDPQARKVDVIREASEAASALTQQLLSISRKQVVQMRLLSINDVVEKSLRVIQGLIGERIRLVVDLGQKLPLVRGDAAQIQQVILNLVVNARDAMPEGGCLLVETAVVDSLGLVLSDDELNSSERRFLRLRVEDTGIGMNEDVKAHLFEPFFTTKKNGRGTGLGLSVTFSIAQEHKAELRVSSEPSQGATFDLLFLVTEVRESQLNPPERWRPVTGDELILVVEDHIAVRVLLTETLRRHGYSVLEADDGKEAMEVIAHAMEMGRSIDLLVTDLVMPRMGGVELAEKFLELFADGKVVFISGYAEDPVEWKDVQRYGQEILSKPFSPDKFLQIIRKVLDRTSAQVEYD